MDLEMDLLDDILADNAAKNARPSGKFRPKAKPKPRKESSASVQSTQCTQPIIISEHESKSASENTLDDTVAIPPLDDNKSSKSTSLLAEHLADKENDASASGSHSEALLSGISGNYNSLFGNLEGEKGDIGSLLENSDGFPSQTTTVNETETTYVDSSRNEEVILGSACDTRVDRGMQRCNTSSFCLDHELPTSLDTFQEEFTLNTDGYFQVGNTSPYLETQNITTEFTSRSGRHTEKLQPKPKPQNQEETHCATVPNPDDVLPVPSQIANFDEGSAPAVPLDDMIDFSSMEFDDSVPTDPVLEISSFVVTSQIDEQNIVPDPSDKERGRTDTGLEHSVEHLIPSTSGLAEKHGRSSKHREKKKHVELVDEPEEHDLETGQPTAEYPKGSAVNEDDHTDKDYLLEDDRPNKKVRGKSKKLVAEKEKTARKRKKASEASEQPTKKSTKKFSHSTRRRGRFDKDWLKTPEDELEISDLPLKDIILLGEYREWIAKKNPETSQTPPVTNQSTAKSPARYYEDYDMLASEHEQEFNDEHENVAVQDNGTYFNYQSHMKKTPRGKWTKQDTELFYEALQQFGTDLTMITQLFPGRSRNQIKLKYKKEERDHPMRLHDALTTRSKDHSHFQLIIDQVKKAVAERKQISETDDLDILSGEQLEGVSPETNEATKSAQVEQSEVEHMEDEVPAATGPAESSDSDDDEKRWSQFRSDL